MSDINHGSDGEMAELMKDLGQAPDSASFFIDLKGDKPQVQLMQCRAHSHASTEAEEEPPGTNCSAAVVSHRIHANSCAAVFRS